MANTPFLDLVKPAGTDRALVSVINSNSDKIDTGVSTLSEQIAMNAFGTKATIAALESALATFGGSMPNNSVRNIVFALDPAQDVFKNANYVGTISRTSSGRYTVLAQSHSSVQSGDLVVGVYANSAWSWQQIVASATASSVPKFLYLGAPTLPVTLNVPSNSRTFLFVSGPYTNRGYGIVVVACNASGSVQPNIVGGNVLSATSSATNKVTIADAVGGTTSSAITAMTIYGDLPSIAT